MEGSDGFLNHGERRPKDLSIACKGWGNSKAEFDNFDLG